MDAPEDRATTRVNTSDVDEAQVRGAEVYYPHRLTPQHRADEFEMHLEAALLGPVAVGVLGYGDEVVIETGDLETSYEVNIPLSGTLQTWTGRDWLLADSATAAVYRPVGDTSLRGWDGGGTLLGVKIERGALERTLADLLGEPIADVIPLGSSLDLTAGFGRHWWSLIRTLLDLATDTSMCTATPQMTRPMIECVLTGLLYAADHPYRAKLDRPEPVRPAIIQQAVEFIDAHPADALSLADLARHAGCSARALQEGFQRHMGVSPMSYLRDVRLDRTRGELLAADPNVTTVAAIAHQCGFSHLGRFAAAYRARYGSTPSRELHKQAQTATLAASFG